MTYDLTKIRIKCAEIVGLVPLPNYPESADAALQLVEWLEAQGWNVHVFFEGGKCTVKLVAHMLTIDSEANTFQLAICLALLRAYDINQWD